MSINHSWYTQLRNYCNKDKGIRERFTDENGLITVNDIMECFRGMNRGAYDWTAKDGIIPTSSFFSQIRSVYDAALNNSNDNYYWGLIESLFFNNSYHANDKRFFYEFGFYANAALIALKMLIKTCDQEKRIPYVFIVTTQSPFELMYNGKSEYKDDGLGFYRASSAYTTIFRETIDERIRNNSPLIVERHVLFAEKK